MSLPSNDKVIGDPGHTEDHNAIVNEINFIKNNYISASSQLLNNYLSNSSASSLYAKISSPVFTGVPMAPTAASGTNTTQIATTEFVKLQIAAIPTSASFSMDGYLTESSASSIYLSKNDASNIYLKISASSNFSLQGYLTASAAQATYLPISSSINFIGGSGSVDLSSYLTLSVASSTYLNISSSADFLRISNASVTYATNNSPTFSGNVTVANISVSGTLDIQEIRETVNAITLSSNVGTLDWTTGNIYFISTAPSANMTWNLTNVPTDNGKAMNITVFVTQGSTGYIPSTVNVNGSAVTVKWPNGITPTPTSSAGKIDIFTLTLIRLSSSWTVIGNASTNF